MANPMAPANNRQIRDAFYVEEDDWKEEVFARTRDMTLAAMKNV